MNKDETMKVVLLEPGKMARIVEMEATLKEMQRIVGGGIEPLYCFDEEVCLICNCEGKVDVLPLNRAVYGRHGEMLDIIAGTAFICDCRGESFASLSDEQLARYKKQFRYPERFIRTESGIRAIPLRPEQEKER